MPGVRGVPPHILRLQGPRITTVFITIGRREIGLLPETDARISIVHSRLPNVTRLHLVLPFWSSVPASTFPLNIPSSVTHFSFKITDRDVECEGDTHLFALVFGLAVATRGSALEVVRLLSPAISVAMRNGVRYEDRREVDEVLFHMTSDSAFRIEDWRGRRHMPSWMEEGKLFFS